MALILDSSAVSQLDGLRKQGIKTLGDAAFVVQLDSSDSTEQILKLETKVFGADPLPGDLARLRRLLTMAHTMAAVEFRRASEEHDGCKMPKPERELRMTALRKKLGSVITTGHNEPSLALISAIFSIKEKNSLAHLPLAQCTSRRQELMGQKTEDKLKMVDGQLKLITGPVLQCDVGNPLLARQAMRRRSLAMELVGIASYEILEAVNEELFGYLQEPPPSSYVPPTLERILRADSELWSLIGEHQMQGLMADATGTLPIDKATQEFCTHARVTHNLQPLPSVSAKGSGDTSDSGMPKRARSTMTSSTSAPKAVAKAKARSNRVPKAPQELVGLPYTSGCCYSYNLKTCDKTHCPHKHICAKCGQKHPFKDCNSSRR